MRILVSGTAGFIGNALALRLLEQGYSVAGVDRVAGEGSIELKESRLARIKDHPRFLEARIAVESEEGMERLFADFRPQRVVHLAARTGVRSSMKEPLAYVESNVRGFVNVLECCRRHEVEHLVFASSSSVYGASSALPFSTNAGADHPVSFYAATKKADEVMAHVYSSQFGLPATGVRIFTVYGPWGRPDMALFRFTEAILAGEPIQVYNRGEMLRDFTYIDDVVEGFARVLDSAPTGNKDWDPKLPDPASSAAPFRIYNLGNGNPVKLHEFIRVLERVLGVQAKKELLPMQAGDMKATFADVRDFEGAFGFRPAFPLEQGLRLFVDWYRAYFRC